MKRNDLRIVLAGLSLAGAYLLALRPSGRRKWAENYRKVLFAHRGFHDNASDRPENSLKAFAEAVNRKYGIELDVQLTKDGVPVVFHDFTLDRMVRDREGRPVNGKLSDYTLEELNRFHLLNSRERIPLLEEVLKTAGGKVPLIVEIKMENSDRSCEVCRKADQLLSEYKGDYVVESFNPRAVLWYRRNRPDLIRGQLSDGFRKETGSLKYLPFEYLLTNFLTRPDFIAFNWKYASNLSRRITRSLYRCPSVAWTIRDRSVMEEMKKQFDILIFDSFDPEKK